MKRFTGTEKWDDSWFRKLPLLEKCFWSFICDRCDNAGVWKLDLEAAEFFMGTELDAKKLIETFAGRIEDIGRGRWWVTNFIQFQYGLLSEACIPHKKIVLRLKEHGLYEAYLSTLEARVVTTHKEEEEEEEEDKDKEGKGSGENQERPNRYSQARIALHWLNDKAGRHYRETARNLAQIQARIDEVKGDIDGIKQMIDRQCARWKGTDQQEYLRPETLFGTEKFNSYYDNRDQPTQVNGGVNKPNARNAGITGDQAERTKRVLDAIDRQKTQRAAVADGMAAAESANGLHASGGAGGG